MASKKSKQIKKSTDKLHRRMPPDWLPRYSLEQANQLPEVLYKVFAGRPTSAQDIAKALKISAKQFRILASSALTYGTINREQGNVYSLSETGRKILAPLHEDDAAEGIRKAVLNPLIPALVYSDYDGYPLPSDDHFFDVLESKYQVPRNRVESAAKIILNNGLLAGIVQPSPSGDQYIMKLSSGMTMPASSDSKFKEPAKEYPLIDASTADWSKICFYITPIGEDGSDVRNHADMMLTHLLTPVLKQFDLISVRADRIERSGLITQQIFEYLVKARLCVADLSFSNPNVFYELGVRHVCKLPTIQIIRKGDRIPFDVAQGRTITVDTSNVYTIMDRMESAKRELTEHIKYFQSQNYQDSAKDNPVQFFLPELKVVLPK